jgi:uncharacterized RDD family membrane protein YckC
MSDQAVLPPSPAYTGEWVAERADKGNMLVRRWAGAWIDFVALALLLFVPAFIVTFLVGLGGASVGRWNQVGGWMVAFDILLAVAYFPVTEGLWGRSLGKLVTGTIVVKRDGTPAGFGLTIVRTVLRLVEVNPFLAGGIPAGIALLCTKGKQRLGDLAAGTYVVPVKALKEAMASESVF